MDIFPVYALFFGFLLGLAHAFDPDHLVAVSTLAVDSKNLRQSSWLGVCWGIGHTSTLVVFGGFVLFLKLSIPVELIIGLEGVAGLMIVALGANVLWNTSRGWTVHSHTHSHDGSAHSHAHIHLRGEESHVHHNDWSTTKAFVVGMVHGLAGSAVLAMAVLAAMPSTADGILYIFLFGLGSISGMTLLSTMIGLPFLWRGRRWRSWVVPLKTTVGAFAIVFGSYLSLSLTKLF